MRAPLLAAIVLTGLTMTAKAQSGQALSPEQRQAVDQMIHDYLLDHPEVVIEANRHAQEATQAAAADALKAKLAAHAEALYHDPTSPVLGNPAGDVTLVEFFDYRCPYCKAAAPVIEQLIGSDPQLRVVLKEFPILGPDSVYASRVALVAAQHGRYAAFHKAMFLLKDKPNREAVLKVAQAVGLDPRVVAREAEAASIDAAIRNDTDLAQTLGIDGTPEFVIAGRTVASALSLAELQALVAEARKSQG